jgi:hypothetical protein
MSAEIPFAGILEAFSDKTRTSNGKEEPALLFAAGISAFPSDGN